MFIHAAKANVMLRYVTSYHAICYANIMLHYVTLLSQYLNTGKLLYVRLKDKTDGVCLLKYTDAAVFIIRCDYNASW